MGAILRSALAYGVEQVFLCAGAPDPLSPLVMRSSAGASLALRYGTEEEVLYGR